MTRAATLIVGLLLLASTWTVAGEELDQHGKAHAWKGEVGELTVIDFAASWCAPCRHSLPKLERFAKEHPELRILVVSEDAHRSGRDRLVADLGLELPVLWDSDRAIAELYQPLGMPSTVVIDAEGEEIFRTTGSAQKEWKAFVAFIEDRLGS